MGDISTLVIGIIDTLFGFFVVAPCILNAVSLFGVQKQFAKAMIDEGVVKAEDVQRIHPKKQIAGTADDRQPRLPGDQALQLTHVGASQRQDRPAADAPILVDGLAAKGVDGEFPDGIGGLVLDLHHDVDGGVAIGLGAGGQGGHLHLGGGQGGWATAW